jgi:phage host-nuclease inhibitor protein Gam
MAKKQKMTTIRSREELEQVLGEYAAQVLERDRLTVAMETEIAAVRQRYEAAVAACVAVGDGLFEDIQSWAMLNPDAFGDRRSLDMLHGTVGFRACPPSVRQVPGVKAEYTLELLADQRGEWTRVKTEVDKLRILADIANGSATEADLRPFGLQVERKEIFFTEIKREDGKEVK